MYIYKSYRKNEEPSPYIYMYNVYIMYNIYNLTENKKKNRTINVHGDGLAELAVAHARGRGGNGGSRKDGKRKEKEGGRDFLRVVVFTWFPAIASSSSSSFSSLLPSSSSYFLLPSTSSSTAAEQKQKQKKQQQQ